MFLRAFLALLALPVVAFGAQPLLLQQDALQDSARVMKRAKSALAEPIVRITDKPGPSPSGDAHDYVSYGRYWWPDPSKPDGLPFIRHDGHHNIEQVDKGDINRLEKFADTVETLAIGWTVARDEAYAKRAGEWLRAWFVDPATRVNPSLDYSQVRPGHDGNRGSKSGVLDGRRFLRALDADRMIEGSGALTAAEEAAVMRWFADYYSWLTTSKLGRAEANSKNNHGTWSLVQELALAIHLGRKDDVKALCERARARIAAQIEADGRQPLEIARVDGLSYSMFNLEAQMRVALLARSVGVDLWSYVPSGGGGLKAAVDYLRPFNSAPQTWRENQGAEVKPGFMDPVLEVAARLDGIQASN